MSNELRETAGVLHDVKSLQRTVDELLIGGIDRSMISVLAGRCRAECDARVALDDATIPRGAFVGCDSRVEGKAALVAGSTYVSAMAASWAAISAGGALWLIVGGTLLAGVTGASAAMLGGDLLDRGYRRYLHEQLTHGGIPMWVRTATPEFERLVHGIFVRNGATGIHLRSFAAPEATRDGGVSENLAWINKPIAVLFAELAR